MTSWPGDSAYPQVAGITSSASSTWRSLQFTAASGRFVATTPGRVLDTRTGVGASRAQVGAGKTLTLTVPGLPLRTTAALLNVTAVHAGASTGKLTPLSPRRVLDTRYAFNVDGGRVGPYRAVTLKVPGLPSSATALVLNLTATGSTAPTYVPDFRAGATVPGTSNLNLLPDQTVANTVVRGLGAGQSVTFYVDSASVHRIADAVAYYSG